MHSVSRIGNSCAGSGERENDLGAGPAPLAIEQSYRPSGALDSRIGEEQPDAEQQRRLAPARRHGYGAALDCPFTTLVAIAIIEAMSERLAGTIRAEPTLTSRSPSLKVRAAGS